MGPRIASAAISLPLLFLAIWIGSLWFALLVAAAAAIGALELCDMIRRWGDRPVTLAAVLGAASLVLAAQLLQSRSSFVAAFGPAAGVGAAVSLAWLIWRPRTGTRISTWGATIGAALYTGGLLLHAPLLRGLHQGREWVLFLLAVTFATDTFAFLVGRAVGQRALVPSISPSKTWEGAGGGVIGAVGASAAAVYALSLKVTVAEALLLGALLGAAGQLGDLVESRLKRMAGVKDSGWVLPGHGGLLDRLDSIVFNLAVVYYFVS